MLFIRMRFRLVIASDVEEGANSLFVNFKAPRLAADCLRLATYPVLLKCLKDDSSYLDRFFNVIVMKSVNTV